MVKIFLELVIVHRMMEKNGGRFLRGLYVLGFQRVLFLSGFGLCGIVSCLGFIRCYDLAYYQ